MLDMDITSEDWSKLYCTVSDSEEDQTFDTQCSVACTCGCNRCLMTA